MKRRLSVGVLLVDVATRFKEETADFRLSATSGKR